MGAPLNLAPGNAQVFDDVGLWARPESFLTWPVIRFRMPCSGRPVDEASRGRNARNPLATHRLSPCQRTPSGNGNQTILPRNVSRVACVNRAVAFAAVHNSAGGHHRDRGHVNSPLFLRGGQGIFTALGIFDTPKSQSRISVTGLRPATKAAILFLPSLGPRLLRILNLMTPEYRK